MGKRGGNNPRGINQYTKGGGKSLRSTASIQADIGKAMMKGDRKKLVTLHEEFNNATKPGRK